MSRKNQFSGTRFMVQMEGVSTISTKNVISTSDSILSDVQLKREILRRTFGSNPSVTFSQNSKNTTIPRSHLPTLMTYLAIASANRDLDYSSSLFDESIQWYLDVGGRLGSLYVDVQGTNISEFPHMGLSPVTIPKDEYGKIFESSQESTANIFYQLNVTDFLLYIENRILNREGKLDVLHNIAGRLQHSLGMFKQAIDSYTQSLLLNPKASAVFRNLGAAYHADGNLQMAFASYQQSISTDPQDNLVYLKLAYLYEDLAKQDYKESFENAQKCYMHYLQQVDPEDTGVLTRLGNMFLRSGMPAEALEVYGKILALEPDNHVAWFNSAHALIKLGGYAGAVESLHKALEGDPSNAAARHMLASLSPEDAVLVDTADRTYVKKLFDDYAADYDKHGKKLLYASPRVIRSELAKIYKVRYEEAMRTAQERQASDPTADKVLPTYLKYMEKSLDILDLGCGTGQAGSWLEDYARSLVGVDLSSEMAKQARKRMVYSEVVVGDVAEFLDAQIGRKNGPRFDLVVAADVMAYIGELAAVSRQVAAVTRPGGLFAFTVETVDSALVSEQKGYVLQPSGRFGFAKPYVTSLAAESGGLWTLIRVHDFAPRVDSGRPVPGALVIMQRSAEDAA